MKTKGMLTTIRQLMRLRPLLQNNNRKMIGLQKYSINSIKQDPAFCKKKEKKEKKSGISYKTTVRINI